MVFLASIRARLILLVLLLVVPAAGLVFTTAAHNRALLEAQARGKLLDTAQRAGHALEYLIRDARAAYFAIGLSPAVVALSEPECSRILAQMLAKMPVYATILATDPAGKGRCSALPLKEALPDYGDREYFRRMRDAADLIVDLPVLGRTSGRIALPIAGPLRDAQGRIVGALIIPPDLTRFAEKFIDASLAPGLAFHLWDRDGKLLFRFPDAEQLSGQRFADLPLVAHAAKYGGSGVIDAQGFDGVARVAAYVAPGGEYAGTGIFISVTQSAESLYAAPQATMRQAFFSMAAIALIGLLAAWLLGSRLIWQQIERITAAVRKMAAGQPAVRVGAPYPGGELGELARSFDHMAEATERQGQDLAQRARDVETLNATLEARVAERTAALEVSEARFRGVLESAADAFVIVDATGRIVIVNAQAVALFGYTREELLNLSVDDLLPESARAAHREQRAQYATAAFTKSMSERHGLKGRRKDGSEFAADVSLSPVQAHEGAYISAVVRDISRAVAAEAELKRANRTLRMLSVCNEALVRAADEYGLLVAICRNVVEVGGYRLAWVGFSLNDAAKTVLPAAQFGNEDYVAQLHITWADEARGRGPTGTAIREARPVTAHRLLDDPDFAPWRASAEVHGFASSIALPLVGRKGVFGVLSLYSAEPEAFDAPEIKLLGELANDLAYGISSLRDSAARARVEHELDFRVSFDMLTGLPNRAVFVDRLNQALVHAARSGRKVAVMLLDLDRFKLINDSLGRSAGDFVLREIARRAASALREGDTVARLSVDEFGVLVSDMAQLEDVLPLAQNLLHSVAQVVHWSGETVQDIFLTGSVGISIYPRDGNDAEHLLRSADTAMHSAKALGGNVFHFFAEDTNRRVSTRIVLDGALRRALEREELQVYYQPKVNLLSGEMIGAEALVRWPHPDMGMISPVEFIPLAEETGLIVPLGEWVLNTACQQLHAWGLAGFSLPTVAVNLSARQFMQQDLLKIIRRALDASGLPAQGLELEITESTAMVEVDKAVGILRELKSLGVHLSLDDFGTGYSSLSYLKRLPIDYLKIDRAFVRDITTDPDDAMICAAVIGLAHNLKMSVIAEGVETEGQMNYLRAHHCDEMQGYYFSRPLPADDFAALLASGRSLGLTSASKMQRTLLLVDDEENVLSALRRLLRRGGYNILTAGSAAEGFEYLANNEVQVVISDQRMPVMNGTAFLRRVKDLYPDTVRMVLSGYTELSSVTDAINQGAIYKFLTKPWEEEDLLQKVKDAFHFYDVQKDKRAGKT